MNRPAARGRANRAGKAGANRREQYNTDCLRDGPGDILAMLEGVRPTGPSRWLARCPAHKDRHPSLNIDIGDDGKILIICRAGCATIDVLRAIGLDWADLFPERKPADRPHHRPARRPFPALDVLRAVSFEARIVACVAADMAAGRELTDEARLRLLTAAERIHNACTAAEGSR